jgi:uncharacterized membrane protein
MTDLSFQSYNAIPNFFQTKLSPIFFYISELFFFLLGKENYRIKFRATEVTLTKY